MHTKTERKRLYELVENAEIDRMLDLLYLVSACGLDVGLLPQRVLMCGETFKSEGVAGDHFNTWGRRSKECLGHSQEDV